RGDLGGEFFGDFLGRDCLGTGLQVLEERAAVLRHEVDGAVLECGDGDLAAANAGLFRDVDALGLEGLGVNLGDELALREVSRTDNDVVAGSSCCRSVGRAHRVTAAAGTQGDGRNGGKGETGQVLLHVNSPEMALTGMQQPGGGGGEGNLV